MDEALDIFRTDDFRLTTMTEMVGDIDTVPTELDAMNIFEPEYLRTTTVTLVSKNGNLTRVATSERGSPEQLPDRKDWVTRQLEGTRLAQRDRIHASEVQNLLNPFLPQPMRLTNAMELVAERFDTLKDNDMNTKEFHRFGALQGKVLDADGVSVVKDFYDEFSIVPPAVVNMPFATVPARELRGKFEDTVVIPMKRALKGRLRPGTKIHSLVGGAYWRKLTDHEGTQRLFELQQGAAVQKLGEGTAWTSFEFADIVFHHYYGSDDGALEVDDDDAIFFPVGAKDVFKVYYLPGENMDEVNAKGKEVYGVVSPDYRPNMNEWVDVYCRSYPLFACLCPQALMRGRRT